ncbi:cold-shock protein [Streptomyces sp. WMMC897]|uniref:cold-shock protein n=1 Tax=Streptomyces sp. WMMC897 TaxID=3014782 RepID=UPI0022B671E2|nr:cold shock domain-containing protein [Streptomyces sp. WMMC897]MCZ7415998.1 cold shock domain-containing protein [Streptomyces sp. WMMC897]
MFVTGKILRFDEVRGYGFIAPDEGHEDVFMHANDLLSEKYLYQPGGRVEFFVEEGEKGPKASEIRLITPGAVAESAPSVRRHVEEAAPASGSAQYAQDEPTCDVLSSSEFRAEVTEILIGADEALTAAQIERIRTCLGQSAVAHGWVDTSVS